jgi:hypothetical protein
MLEPAQLRAVSRERRDLAALGIDGRVAQLARFTAEHDQAGHAVDAAYAARLDARGVVLAAGDQLQRLSRWRLSSWQLRPTFETDLRHANDQLRDANHNLDTARNTLATTAAARHDAQDWVHQHRAEIERWPDVNADLVADLDARVTAAHRNPPSWALATLGPCPVDLRAGDAWDRAVATTDQYRNAWDITNPHDPLGPQPAVGTNQAADWRAASRALGDAYAQLGRDNTRRTPSRWDPAPNLPYRSGQDRPGADLGMSL